MKVAPFAALRYDAGVVGDLGRVVSLPYDQFDEAGREARYRADPHHVVRLIRPRGGAAEAAATLRRWTASGVLRRDPTPAFYGYRQRFRPPDIDAVAERWALVARVRLTPLATGPVRPHERTFPETVGDRVRLREAVGADLGLILMTVEDPDGVVDATVRGMAGGLPVAGARDETGTDNALWRCDDGAAVESLIAALEPARAIIADGHHRYTAALSHWESRGGSSGDDAGWVMAALVSERDPGLRILPIHRLTREEAPVEALARAGAGFRREELGRGDAATVAGAAARGLELEADDHAFVVVRRAGDGLRADRLRAPRGSQAAAEWPADVPASWRRLDVTVLHHLLLGSWLGAAAVAPRQEHGDLAFTNDLREAVDRVATGERGSAFLMRPLPLGALREVVEGGGVLPAKSTNFHPKAIAGLLVHAFGEPAAGGDAAPAP